MSLESFKPTLRKRLASNSVIVLPNINLKSVNPITRVDIITDTPSDLLDGKDKKKNNAAIHDKNVDVFDEGRTAGTEYD